MTIPKVFISYSHDNLEHKKWVLEFAIKLRNSGIDAIIDQWELQAGDDLPSFMEKQLTSADYIFMVCSKEYVTKANSGIGGVGYEKMIITSEFLKNIDTNKIIPIIRQNGTTEVPNFLKTKLYINLSSNVDFEFGFDELIRTVHKSPLYKKPQIGNNPFSSSEKVYPEKSHDSLRELMSLLIIDFEKGEDYSNYIRVVERMSISRVYLDMVLKDAISKRLVFIDEYNDLFLTDKGKEYSIQHKLVKGDN